MTWSKQACWPSTPPGSTHGKRAKLLWYYAVLKYGDFARGASHVPARRIRPRRGRGRDRALQARGREDVARKGHWSRALRFPAADVAAHTRRVLEPGLGCSLQRPRMGCRLGGQSPQGENAHGGRFQNPDGKPRVAADPDVVPARGLSAKDRRRDDPGVTSPPARRP